MIFADRVELDDSRRPAASTVLRGQDELRLVFVRGSCKMTQDNAAETILNFEALVKVQAVASCGLFSTMLLN